jgi:hypothetical protein
VTTPQTQHNAQSTVNLQLLLDSEADQKRQFKRNRRPQTDTLPPNAWRCRSACLVRKEWAERALEVGFSRLPGAAEILEPIVAWKNRWGYPGPPGGL